MFDCNNSFVFNIVFSLQEVLEVSLRACGRGHVYHPKCITYDTPGLPAGCSTLLAQAHSDIWLTVTQKMLHNCYVMRVFCNLHSSVKACMFRQ